ncbi:MAG: type II secretion system secretin GspD [Burkholderiales bacterium]|jgi:general secretion pathway protein D|nr:type II secretion system secretin GspD [Burkholderiales bacterium]
MKTYFLSGRFISDFRHQRSGILLFAELALTFALVGCATPNPHDAAVPVSPNITHALAQTQAPYSKAIAETADRAKTGADDPDRVKVFKGTGVMIKAPEGGDAPSVRQGVSNINNILLNFEGTDLREIIHNILGEILGENYVIDPTVNGQVTIRSMSGLNGDDLYATLETILRMNGATMVKENGVFKILPASLGVKGSVTPQLGNSERPLPKGYSVQILPLRYVSASEMAKILEPFAKEAAALRADDKRNLMILSGTESELQHLIETVALFDVDWMEGMSSAIFTLRNSDAKEVAQELATMFGSKEEGGLFAAVRLFPIERLNILIAITPQAHLIDTLQKWIERLDEDVNGDVPRLYVYSLKYARADRVTPLLQQAFTGRTITPSTAPAQLANHTTGANLSSPSSTQSRTQTANRRNPAGNTNNTNAARAQNRANPPANAGLGIAKDIQVVADEDHNTILIVATPREYELVDLALKKLDVPQRQVMIEVTLAEVKLEDKTSIGTRWWFTSGDIYGGLGAVGPLKETVGEMFNLIIKPGKTIDSIIQAAGTTSNVKLVANPHIAALDNQQALIEVTDSLPIQTTTYVGTNDNVASGWEYIKVGVSLKITPHINEGGNVTMEAEIEFSGKGAGADQALNQNQAPPTTSRLISTQMVVPSGGTMVLGGLIRDDVDNSNSGVPMLSRIPIIGGLFGNQSWNSARTELVIFITPRVVNDNETRRAIIQDLRYRMDNLERTLQKSKVLPPDLKEPAEAMKVNE